MEDGRTVYRSKTYAVGTALCIPVYAIGTIKALVAPGATTAGLAGGVIVAIALGIVLIRFARAAVLTTADGVLVRGPFRTRRIAWPDVAGFEVGGTVAGSDAALLVSTDGRRLRLWGLGGPARFVDPAGADGARCFVPQLNAALETHRRLASGTLEPDAGAR